MSTETAAATVEAAAKALLEAASALRAVPTARWFVNQDLSDEDLAALPIGSRVLDKDRDEWEKLPRVGWKYGGNSNGTLKIEDYRPVLLTEVGTDGHDPEPTPEPEPEPTGLTVTLPDVELEPSSFQSFRKTYRSVGASSAHPKQSFTIQKSVNTGDGAAVFLNAYGVGEDEQVHLHLSKDDALELAAALVKVATSERTPW